MKKVVKLLIETPKGADLVFNMVGLRLQLFYSIPCLVIAEFSQEKLSPFFL